MARLLVAWLKSGRFVDLIFARHHTSYLTRHRLTAIVSRAKLVAAAFSVLTLAWIGFDIATLDMKQWLPLAVARIVSAAIFFLLAITPQRERDRIQAIAMLATILAMPLAIYGVSQFLFVDLPLDGLAAINGDLYRALPSIVLAGLSIFPLVACEGLAFAGVIAAAVAGIQLTLAGASAVTLFSTLWVLMLTLGVYLLAGAIQLHYMMSLLRRASLDPLTGALTRRSGVEVLDIHFGLACDQDAPLSVLFVDADNFKSINDNYGHDAGDKALKAIAATLHDYLRQADVVIRWGGEEFVVVLANTPASGAEIVVRRIMRDWLGTRPDSNPLTASMGLSERKMDAVSDWSQLIALADERMYVAKTSGKARCVGPAGVIQDGAA